ncbi:unnamed protein product [Microthlaspi erraticum]|uniref:RINT1-like protein MAG2L n=1 Tax=Microthlaspi erraticum TaxID=1685480 RepID=A0A6D2L1E2_9BRAS|nr:unnamed protein product [Microthlaspi erraticum]
MEHRLPLSFVLPNPTDLPVLALGFLDGDFEDLRDLLLCSTNLTSHLKHDSSHLNDRLLHLRTDLTKHAVSWISTSLTAKVSLDDLKLSLLSLSESGTDALGNQTNQELHQLVEELCRIQNTQRYFVTALKLESLVGDLEDSVFHPISNRKGSMLQDLAFKQNRSNHAIKTMNEIEEILGDVTRHHSQWRHLVDSVDSRVDKSLSILRPQIIADHRAFLSSLGWPPKLATSKVDNGEVASIPNPLLLMQEDQKEAYSQSFLLLCGLQKLNTMKEQRKHTPKGNDDSVGLWATDELVIPVASRLEYHFMKWAEQPEFIFELVYKVTRDFADGIDDTLQPLIDRARLVSCSAKEAWVSAMVQMLSCFLEKKVFPGLVETFKKEKQMKPEVVSSWFHLVDQMVTFDKRMQSFVDSDIFLGSSVAFSQGMSVMGLFCKKPEWLKTWGKIELKDAYRKLKEDIKNEKAWLVVDSERSRLGDESNSRFVLSTREDYKAPFVAESFLSRTWTLIEHGLSLPEILPRIQFVRATATKFLWYVFKILLLEFGKIDFSEDNSFEDTLKQACGPINAARFLESKLREWCDDVVLVEMWAAETSVIVDRKPEASSCHGCFFGEELKGLVELETNWLMEIITACLHQFDNLCSDHFNDNVVSWEEEDDIAGSSDVTVSQGVAEALDSLRRHLCVLQLNMNPKDFLDLWRNLAQGLDHYVSCKFFSGVVLRKRFKVDAEALLMVFQPYCVRPAAFFPHVREILRL